ncbi:hypothetical protein DB823_24145, partial [Xanthomonas perforans]
MGAAPRWGPAGTGPPGGRFAPTGHLRSPSHRAAHAPEWPAIPRVENTGARNSKANRDKRKKKQ